MKRALFFLLVLTALVTAAQQPAGERKPRAARPEAAPPSPSKSDATKPDTAKPQIDPALGDFSGTYSFLKEAEYLQINLEDDRVTGFVSRFGNLESDAGAFLEHFFEKASLTGNKLSFTTKKTHGVWFEFTGTAERGPAKTPAEEGYYVLKGRLTQHNTDAAGKPSGRFREVVFKSFPVEPEPAPAAKKTD
ncbi:MAG: hypothetical protein L0099_05165 [Acidobacteria bacterium]|nr:hypothetical protein [Acidobacteriota bacterium]